MKASGHRHRVPDVLYTLSGQRRLHRLSGILRLLLELARELDRHLLALVPHLDLDLDLPLALVLVLVLDDSSLLHDI